MSRRTSAWSTLRPVSKPSGLSSVTVTVAPSFSASSQQPSFVGKFVPQSGPAAATGPAGITAINKPNSTAVKNVRLMTTPVGAHSGANRRVAERG